MPAQRLTTHAADRQVRVAGIELVRQRHGEVVHVLVSKLEDLSECLRGLASQSRAFRQYKQE